MWVLNDDWPWGSSDRVGRAAVGFEVAAGAAPGCAEAGRTEERHEHERDGEAERAHG
jgi:hypothetical protein